ncbi:MAG: SDR family oxidoreductase [Alphaproteobacteria bacterium]|nr:SDR family oxidoreductase [Alphaproteobacteria bacterium]MCB9695862.1 SDR family oxidoreductase [Alphaproteobacteria bacterium]
MNLGDVRAVVTGGARGMGRHFAQAFAAEGANVVFCDVGAESVAAAASEIGVKGIAADVSREDDVERLFAEAEELMGGPVNVLLNNAGILRDGLLLRKDKETGAVKVLDKAKWDAVLAVNLTGPFLCARQFAKRAVETDTRPAVVVNMSSISRAGNMGQSNYAAAKAGLVADTATWARELARYGIRVGAIAPGFIRTPMVEEMRPEMLEKMVQPVPMRRIGEPSEIWEAVRFIVRCDYFTGRVVEVDGGLVL